jgi:hypothetical protein
VFTALWDPIREDPDKAVTSEGMKRQVVDLMAKLLALVRSYAVVYKVCRPHTAFCVALRTQITRAMNPVETPVGSLIELRPRRPLSGRVRAWLSMGAPDRARSHFLDIARHAEEHGMTWVQGLALLECPDDASGAWTTAYDIFSRSEFTEYELKRAHGLFVRSGLPLPPRSWVRSFMERGEDM